MKQWTNESMNKSDGLQSGAIEKADQEVRAFGDRVMQNVAGRGEFEDYGTSDPAISDLRRRELQSHLPSTVESRIRRQNWRGRR